MDQTQTPNKWSKMGAGKVGVGVVLIAFNVFRPALGFIALDGFQALGYNVATLLVYGFAIGLIYYGIRPVYQK